MSLISIKKQINSLQAALDEFKFSIGKRPKTIEKCTNKKQLELFSSKKLRKWLLKNHGHEDFIRKIDKKEKKDIIKIIWEIIEDYNCSESDTDTDTDSQTDSDSEGESDSD